VGIAILIIFISIAVLAPWLTPYDPLTSQFLADEKAMPQWVTIFPQYKDLPPTTEIVANWHVKQGSNSVHVKLDEESVVVRYSGGGTEKTDIYLDANFLYPYSPPKGFMYRFSWAAEKVQEVGYSLELILVSPEGQEYSLWDSYYCDGSDWTKKTTEIPLLREEKNSTCIQVHSSCFELLQRLGLPIAYRIAGQVFSVKGEYYLLMHVVFEPKSTSESTTAEIILKDTKIRIPGLIHGILGTDHSGKDLFSQFVYGTRTSLMIGVLAAFSITVIGTIVGVTAGYLGGVADEILMRITDVTLCLPMLPVLITLAALFGSNVFFIILILAVLWWSGLARIIRSRVLSLREMTFIVSAKAVGASRSHIILKHIMPNVLPLAFAAMVLNVPSAIITEATLSFIGFSDPVLPTWGKMLHDAFYFGAFKRLAWWWIVPPGLALMILALAFVFIGHAMDEIVNPRLRRRR